MVLWTRLAPKPLDFGGGMSGDPIMVGWEVSKDDSFKAVVRKGQAVAKAEAAHSVHVEISGLKPDHIYYYRFFSGEEQSPVGRTRTTPKAHADIRALRYAFTACQHYEANHYAPYRQLVDDDPALILFLGDYIYESAGRHGHVRRHPDIVAHDLPTYRQRYAVYKSDPLLQAAHAAAPWMTIWDDHEVANNYRGTLGDRGDNPVEFLKRRAAAYQAYYEHMPLRCRAMPLGSSMQLYRKLDWGRLAQFQFIDTRQYRDFTPCFATAKNFDFVTDCAERLDQKRSALGATQENWLFDALAQSNAAWNILAQQSIMAEILRHDPETQATGYSTDGWDSDPADRDRILNFWRDRKISNPMALGGDTHAFVASELSVRPDSPVISSCFVGGSLASGSGPADAFQRMMGDNPHVRYSENQKRGYALVDVTREESRITFKAADNSADPNSATSTLARFVVENGKPGLTVD